MRSLYGRRTWCRTAKCGQSYVQMNSRKQVMWLETDVGSELPLSWQLSKLIVLITNFALQHQEMETEQERDFSKPLIKIHSVIQLWTSLYIVITWGLNNCMSALFCVKTCVFFCVFATHALLWETIERKVEWQSALQITSLRPNYETWLWQSAVSAAQLLVELANTSDSEHSFRSTLVHFSLETLWFNYCLVVLSLPLVKCWSFLTPLTIITWISYTYGASNEEASWHFIVQELCESQGGRPGLSVLTSLLVSVDVNHASALVSACP